MQEKVVEWIIRLLFLVYLRNYTPWRANHVKLELIIRRSKLRNFWNKTKYSVIVIYQIILPLTLTSGNIRHYILFSTSFHLKNAYYLYSACSNPTNVVLVSVLSMIIGKGAWYWDRQSWSVCNHPSNHDDNIIGIRTRVIEIGWENDIYSLAVKYSCSEKVGFSWATVW